MEGWQSDVAFAERHLKLQKIQQAVKHGNPELSQKEATLEASNIERKAFESSSSKQEYLYACESAAQILDDETLPEESEVEARLSPAAETIGQYSHAHHWRDGLFSSVYKAATPEGDSAEVSAVRTASPVVALKVTTPSMMAEPHDSEREARILREAASQHIIALLETFQVAGGRFVLVFPFMPLTLEEALRSGKLRDTQIKSHLRDLFSGLGHLHSHGIIHRDVKPSNMLLKSLSGPAYLADFGIAWSPIDKASEDKDEKITDVGTTCYRPPELLFGNKAYGCSLDLWAAGCVVAEAASHWQHKTLFNSGDLGSELALIQSIFMSLGTPDLTVWPEAAGLPDWGKMEFKKFPPKSWSELLPEAPATARSLISQLVCYESGQRLSARGALEHEYLAS